MLVIHGLWSATGRLLLWGEDSALPSAPPRRPGRRPQVQVHPYACGADDLVTALGGCARKAAALAAVLRLPARGDGPAPSPELVREETPATAAGGGGEAADWRVPALAYEPDHVAAALRELVENVEVTLGGPVRHLIDISAFADDLAARGRVLPTLVMTADGPTAGWRPVLTGDDVTWARALAMALPPAGRAEVTGQAEVTGPPELTGRAEATRRAGTGGRPVAGETPAAATVVGAALDALVDAAARSALGARPLSTPRGGVLSRWLRALTSRQRTFTADAAEVAALGAELATWQKDVAGGPVRACFRLVAPFDEDDRTDGAPPAGGTGPAGAAGAAGAAGVAGAAAGAGAAGAAAGAGGSAGRSGPGLALGWRLEFALQATDEPSLVVGAERVWRSRGTLRALARHVESPQETLLAELGRASRLYPALEPALRAARPAALDLDLRGAHEFLAEAAPLLATAGFGVLLPSWWGRPSTQLGVRLAVRSPKAPGSVSRESTFGMNSLVDYRWELALGDEKLTATEMRALTTLQAPMVRLRGQWVQVDPQRLAAGLALLRANGAGQMSVARVLRSVGSVDDEGPGGLAVTGVSATGWLGSLLSGTADQRLRPVRAPAGFVGALRPYQERGLAWLGFLQKIGLGAILADDMGLGKTVQLLALMAADPPDAGPTLLVCPMSLVGNWQREAARFAPGLGVHVHHGAERPRGKEFAAAVGEANLVITTYALAARDAKDLAKVAWHRAVIDEAQAIKNAATKQAAAVRALPARHRVAMTGTPVENRLADLWSLLEFANPGLLDTAPAFKRRYAEPIERHGDDDAAARLRRLTQPFILRRVKTDKSIITDLPEKLEMEILCNLTREQASLYQAVVDDMLDRIENSAGIERRGLVLATMTKLKQVCNHPAQLLRDGSRLTGRSGKLARLEEILDEVLAAGERALLFSQYAEFGAMLRAHLSARFAREVLFLHGGVSKAGRDDMVARFQAGGPALFVLSLKAGGTGLNLTAANHVVHVDRWWNPAVEDQATDRAFRIGQSRAVQVRKFVCAGTLEEKISAMIRDKRGLAAKIVGSGEQWLTELSTAQLRELITLEAGTVVE